MKNKGFKNVFDQVAKSHDFEKAYGGWFKKSEECIAVLELQKSSFANKFYLNIKIFIQGLFGTSYILNKDLIKSPMGDITKQIRDILALDIGILIDGEKRKQELIELFQNQIISFVSKVMTRNDIIDMHLNHGLVLLPAVKKELGI